MAKRTADAKTTPESILQDHTPQVRELAQRLRRIIQEAVPEAKEKSYPSWHGIGYSHPQVGYFCAIFPQADCVMLGFEFGVLLPDPQGVLAGDGKQVRYVTLQDEAHIPLEAIQALLSAATSPPAGPPACGWCKMRPAHRVRNKSCPQPPSPLLPIPGEGGAALPGIQRTGQAGATTLFTYLPLSQTKSPPRTSGLFCFPQAYPLHHHSSWLCSSLFHTVLSIDLAAPHSALFIALMF